MADGMTKEPSEHNHTLHLALRLHQFECERHFDGGTVRCSCGFAFETKNGGRHDWEGEKHDLWYKRTRKLQDLAAERGVPVLTMYDYYTTVKDILDA